MFLGLSVVSCTDGNDWGLDSAFDRLFGVGEDDITVETTATTATVTFVGNVLLLVLFPT